MGKKAKGIVTKGAFTALMGFFFGPAGVAVSATIVGGKEVGSALQAVGLNSLGKEVQRWGQDAEQVAKVITGQYHDDMKNIQSMQNTVDMNRLYVGDKVKSYNLSIEKLQDRLDSLIAFDEIFKMAMANRIEGFVATESPKLQAIIEQYNMLVAYIKLLIAQLKSEYDFVIGLTEGPFVQRFIGSIIMIIGGLVSDMKDIATGKANSATWKRIGTTAAFVIAIVILVLLFVPTGGLSAAPLAAIIAIVATSISAFLALDGMYANGAATGAVMSMLDFLFNDILNLDNLIGSDFEKFDKNHEDYQEMVGYVKLSIMLVGIIAAWAATPANVGAAATAPGATAGSQGLNIGTAAAHGTKVGSEQTAMLAAQDAGLQANVASYGNGALQIGDTMATSSLLGVQFSTFSDIYKAFSMAQSANDVVSMNDQHKQMKKKLEDTLAKVNTAIDTKTNKRMMGHYKDSAYFLQDQQEQIDTYIWSMTAENMYVDPYGTTPVANIRFTPDKDTRLMSFGYEDMFNENKVAGSKNYFNNIIYGG